MKKIDLIELSSKYNLGYVEVTTNRTGYPENLSVAITGFLNFEKAQAFADEHNLILVKIVKKRGQNIYIIEGNANREYDVTEFIDESKYYNRDDLNFIKETLVEKIEEAKDFETLQEIVSDMNDLITAINESDEDDDIVVRDGNEVINRYAMTLIDDGKEYAIGAVDENTKVINAI